jgi:hypothetical protein
MSSAPTPPPGPILAATIFTKGDPGNSLFAVCSGTIRIAVKTSWKPSHLRHKVTLVTLCARPN